MHWSLKQSEAGIFNLAILTILESGVLSTTTGTLTIAGNEKEDNQPIPKPGAWTETVEV